jgi:hypothetical protein
VLLQVTELLQHGVALRGRAQYKHLHLAKLVHAVQPPARRPCMQPGTRAACSLSLT